jgi:hypothetical protein
VCYSSMKSLGPADNRRVSQLGAMGGWDQMRSRLRHEQLFFFSACTEAIRTIPLLQHDQDRPEDLDTESEDHAADSVRYACMSRPYTRSAPKPKEPEPMRGIGSITRGYVLTAGAAWVVAASVLQLDQRLVPSPLQPDPGGTGRPSQSSLAVRDAVFLLVDSNPSAAISHCSLISNRKLRVHSSVVSSALRLYSNA